MAAKTFGDVWRRVALQVPGAPASLCQEWVQSTYNTLLGTGHWAWLRATTVLTTQAQRTLALVNFTQGSTAITSAALFLTTDVGRQIRIPNQTIYTIATVTNPSAADLTIPFAEPNAATSARVQDYYLAMPADFRSIYSVTDMDLQRPIAWWISRDRLDLFDPARIASNNKLRVLASYELSLVPSLLGRVLYEGWPPATSVGQYQLMYFKRTDTLADDDAFQGVLSTYTDALVEGALSWAARWPGTTDKKNPYFNLQLAKLHADRFDAERQTLQVMDDDQYLMMLEQINLSKFGLAALAADTTLMRESDATLADYY
jgi:hypothetical protein